MSISDDFSTLPSHLIELRDGPPESFAHYGIHSARERRYQNHRNVSFFCRHQRQAIDDVERWPVPKFNAYLKCLGDHLEKEFPDPTD